MSGFAGGFRGIGYYAVSARRERRWVLARVTEDTPGFATGRFKFDWLTWAGRPAAPDHELSVWAADFSPPLPSIADARGWAESRGELRNLRTLEDSELADDAAVAARPETNRIVIALFGGPFDGHTARYPVVDGLLPRMLQAKRLAPGAAPQLTGVVPSTGPDEKSDLLPQNGVLYVRNAHGKYTYDAAFNGHPGP